MIGGGVIGLSIAYEAARHGATVRLLERGTIGRQASWAGAGILPPGSWYSEHPALEELAKLSYQLYPTWSERLLQETGIDNQYEPLGARYIPDSLEDEQELERKFADWRGRGIEVHSSQGEQPWFFVPGEAQVRNTQHLAALEAGCRQLGVEIAPHSPIDALPAGKNRIDEIISCGRCWHFDHLCLAAGAWTGGLLRKAAPRVTTEPVRGQMLLLKMPERAIDQIIHSGGRYIVPRRDGHVLVGSTLERVGFDCSTNEADIAALYRFACDIEPQLERAEVVKSWAGLRPATEDGLPLIGPVPGYENAYVATGHYRSGLQFSPATAVVMRELVAGVHPSIDSTAFSILDHEGLEGHEGIETSGARRVNRAARERGKGTLISAHPR